MDEFGLSGLSSLAELNYMRLEAMDLFDHCLTEGKSDRLIDFIEQQISQDPPRIELLREVGDDLHQRLMGLHENYLDAWQRTLATLKTDYALSIDKEFASKPFNKFEDDDILDRLGSQQLEAGKQTALRKTLDAVLETATQLRADIAMTERLYVYICDWIDGLNATVARRFWAEGRSDEYTAGMH